MGSDSVWSTLTSMDGPLQSIMRPLVEPLVDQLDFITGDQDAVRSTAETWRDMATQLRAVASFQEQTATVATRAWTGEASEAFAALMTQLVDAAEQVADGFDDTAGQLDLATEQVQEAERTVEDLIIELLQWAIVSLAAGLALAAFTAGISAGAGAALAASRAAVTGARIANLLRKLAKALEKFADLLKAIKAGEKGKAVKFMVKSQVFGRGIKAATGIDPDPLGALGIDTEGLARDVATYG